MSETQSWAHYPLIGKQLIAVNHCLQNNIKTSHLDLQKALVQMANHGGKYLRPGLLLLSAKIAGQGKADSQRLIHLAASIEVLHMATLIHDDIIDDSDERRGRISIQARFGKDTAVYAGDLLFTNFFDLLLGATNDHHYLHKNAQTMHRILNGELDQMAQRFNLDQKIDHYLQNIAGKTAALFALATEEGAHFAGADTQKTELMRRFGQQLGMAFQIVDDMLDYTGGQKLNKPILEDLATGVYSAPLLLAMKQPQERKIFLPLLKKKRQIAPSDIKQIQQTLIHSSAMTNSRQLAEKYTNQALAILQHFPPSPANQFLQQMTKRLIFRTK